MVAFEDRLVDLIAQESGLDGASLKASPGLMSQGILDSFALVSVISLVEETLGCEVPPADLSFDNIDTVVRICAYVERASAA